MSKIIYANKNTNLEDNISQHKANNNSHVASTVKNIIQNIKTEGNEALFRYTKEFDSLTLNENTAIFSKKEIDQAYNNTEKKLRDVIKRSYNRVYKFHQKQHPENYLTKDPDDIVTGWKWYPIDSVGLYIPGGLASYPSSVIMTGTIARAAGVKEIIMTMPCPNGNYNPSAIAAAKIIGIDRIYKVGGSQAIAALAYGSTLIPKTCKIVGPGNAYVAEAKKQVFGDVGIDSIAGPSEILIIADNAAPAEWVALDLLSQAEHDPNARAILITDSKQLANDVEVKILQTLPKLERSNITTQSWNDNGKIIIVDSLQDTGIALANKIAPEHLELIVENTDHYVNSINNAGAIFIGKYSTEAIGDYIAGPSHVLPTSGTAKFSSALSIYDFLRKSTIINCNKNTFNKVADDTILFAQSEGLECHAKAVKIRK